jgi:hypothetical protein
MTKLQLKMAINKLGRQWFLKVFYCRVIEIGHDRNTEEGVADANN